MQINFDIDLDFANRDAALAHLTHIPASIIKNDNFSKHATGVYFNDIPTDPVSGYASLDYKVAESRGDFKLDFLNVNVYRGVIGEAHLQRLITTAPPWQRLHEQTFVEQLLHINSYYDVIQRLDAPINSITRLAMFLAVLRPGKKHLINLSWNEMEKTIWEKTSAGFAFKKSHSFAYSHLVVLHMNLLNGVV